MFLKDTLIFFILLFVNKVDAQTITYNDALKKAIDHRQTQNIAHVILWDTEPYLLNADSFSVDQEKGLLIVKKNKLTIRFNIKILGTQNRDSTFLWSIYNSSIRKELTTPVSNLFAIAKTNQWNINWENKIICTGEEAANLATLAFYFDHANGINHVLTNGGTTSVLFAFYEVEVYDNAAKKLITKIPVKKQYEIIDAPDIIDLCKNYIAEFDANEKKYNEQYKKFNENRIYIDTMFANRIKISDKYWDTTSLQYPLFRKNRLQAHNLENVMNWRAVTIGDIKYVLYDVKETWGSLTTWAFKICQANNKNKICNEYVSF